MTGIDPRLTRLGDALEQAAAEDLVGTRGSSATRRNRWLLSAAVLAAAIPGLAFAANSLLGTDEVARSLPAGTLALLGTEPTCTAVTANVEYHCTLARAPAPEVTDAAGHLAWKGTVEPSVDDTKHVNGGCRSLRTDGREWECYIGQAAVDQKIVSADFLGGYAPQPGVG
jgi:hypothetical protein